MVTMYPIDAAMLCFDNFQSPVNALLTGDVEQQQLHSSLNSRPKFCLHASNSILTSACGEEK